MSRSVSYITRRAIIAAVAVLVATACAGTAPPATVVERELPSPDRAKKVSKASQPAKPALQPASNRSGVAEPVLLYWEIRKEGK